MRSSSGRGGWAVAARGCDAAEVLAACRPSLGCRRSHTPWCMGRRWGSWAWELAGAGGQADARDGAAAALDAPQPRGAGFARSHSTVPPYTSRKDDRDRPDHRRSRCAAPRDHCCLEAQRPLPCAATNAGGSALGSWLGAPSCCCQTGTGSGRRRFSDSLARNRQRHLPARRRVLRGHRGRRCHHRDHRAPFIYETAARDTCQLRARRLAR